MTNNETTKQDMLFNEARKLKKQLLIALVDGTKLRGLVKGFDRFSLSLVIPGTGTVLLFKHAIAYIVFSGEMPILEAKPAPAAAPKAPGFVGGKKRSDVNMPESVRLTGKILDAQAKRLAKKQERAAKKSAAPKTAKKAAPKTPKK